MEDNRSLIIRNKYGISRPRPTGKLSAQHSSCNKYTALLLYERPLLWVMEIPSQREIQLESLIREQDRQIATLSVSLCT